MEDLSAVLDKIEKLMDSCESAIKTIKLKEEIINKKIKGICDFNESKLNKEEASKEKDCTKQTCCKGRCIKKQRLLEVPKKESLIECLVSPLDYFKCRLTHCEMNYFDLETLIKSLKTNVHDNKEKLRILEKQMRVIYLPAKKRYDDFHNEIQERVIHKDEFIKRHKDTSEAIGNYVTEEEAESYYDIVKFSFWNIRD